MELLRGDGLSIEARSWPAPMALFSVDIETDFGCGRTEALEQLPRVIDAFSELGVPWTAFVEGQFFETLTPLVRRLVGAGVDVQLHCYDHSQPGDTPATLARSTAAYADLIGRRPAGYRAHTYRLTRALYDALLREGFRWDSSIMRAFAQGRNSDARFAVGDYLILDGRLVEFPIATWHGLPVAFNHTHVALLKRAGEAMMRGLFGTAPLVVYNAHMTDLVRCDSLRFARRTLGVRILYRYLWCTHRQDTLRILRRVIGDLRERGYAFSTTDDAYEAIAESARGASSAPLGAESARR
jgi:peptidoglycan/xylan/chitin deacetylase (PgdA/CDA1 family)